MAGHSKWQNIKRKKGINDAKKSKVFTKVTRLITVAARQGGGDPETNPALRLAVDKAKYANMPKDNVERAILRGTGDLDGVSYEEVVYEGYGPSGVAFVVNTLTDNKNRTVAEIKNIFTKYNGSLGAPGSASYIFDSENNPTFTVNLDNEKDLSTLEKLYNDLEDNDDVQDILTNLENFLEKVEEDSE